MLFNCFKVKIKNFFYILLACYTATFLRLFIDNNFIISILGSFFVGCIIRKKLSHTSENIFLVDLYIFCTQFLIKENGLNL